MTFNLEDKDLHISHLEQEIETLRSQLDDANNIIDAIRDGSVDALVVQKEGKAEIYSIESADYTYRILIEKFGEGALSISDDGLILYCNDYFSQLIGIPASKITGSYFTEYVNSHRDYVRLKNSLNDGPVKGEFTLKGNDRNIPVYISLTDLHPTVPAIGVVVTDLSEKKGHELALVKHQHELEDKIHELNASNTSLEQFIHVISHDLKEPLRKILMYTARLNGSEENEDAVYHNIIKSSALRLNSLVDDLVKYAFIANKDEELKISLDEVLKEVIDDLEITIQEKAAIIESDSLPVIKGSKVQMRQLFSNLIINAIKYSRENGIPVIKIKYAHDIVTEGKIKYHKVSITDNGIGMEKAHISKIFTIFQRLHMRNEYSGNGIGLAICKKIMENHNGHITVESIIGSGSTFNLYFPVNDIN
ncbi:histidine kinase [Flavobacterium rivuli WB 3.3-2 = DSM 21788]|uniref:histidine kinase n=1 Tax=Flavobacterium rivuli WB 3.3-2 = DSM 21788 TaxID=1121895 RepID=A0A0A2M1R5_9FLAO|nr:histidine kinase [Flavobacterium rivuli WB 3.3-2 = DSM 21788]